MTEEDFIKKYFNSKSIINESGEAGLMAAFLVDIFTSTNPIAQLLVQYLGYEAARGAANFSSGIKNSSDIKNKTDSRIKSIDNNLKNKSTKDILKKLKITNTIKNKSNKYLKYFLIMFSVMNYLSKKQQNLECLNQKLKSKLKN